MAFRFNRVKIERGKHFIGKAFNPDGIKTSKTFHWAGKAGKIALIVY